MGILPEQGLWQSSGSRVTPRGHTPRNVTPRGSTPGGATPRTSTPRGSRSVTPRGNHSSTPPSKTRTGRSSLIDSEFPRRGKRTFHDEKSKNGISLRHGGGSNPMLERRNSAPSLQSVGASPAAGIRQSRAGQIRSDCAEQLGRQKLRHDAAYVESKGYCGDADRVHEFRYYIDPADKQLGRRGGTDENEPGVRPSAAEHRYYAAPEQPVVGKRRVSNVARGQMAAILQQEPDGKSASSQSSAQEPQEPWRKEALRYCPESGRGLGKKHVDPGILHADRDDGLRYAEDGGGRAVGRRHMPEGMQLHADKNDFLRFEPSNAASIDGTMDFDSQPRRQQISTKHARASGRSASWSSLYSGSEDTYHLQEQASDSRASTRAKSVRSCESDSTASEPHGRRGVRVMSAKSFSYVGSESTMDSSPSIASRPKVPNRLQLTGYPRAPSDATRSDLAATEASSQYCDTEEADSYLYSALS